MDYTAIGKDGYTTVFAWMLDENLTGAELCVYALLYGYTTNAGSYNNGISYLMAWTRLSRATIYRVLKTLESKKRIARCKIKDSLGRRQEIIRAFKSPDEYDAWAEKNRAEAPAETKESKKQPDEEKDSAKNGEADRGTLYEKVREIWTAENLSGSKKNEKNFMKIEFQPGAELLDRKEIPASVAVSACLNYQKVLQIDQDKTWWNGRWKFVSFVKNIDRFLPDKFDLRDYYTRNSDISQASKSDSNPGILGF